MKTIYLVVWLFSGYCDSIVYPNCPKDNPAIQSQTVSSEEELNEVYKQHKDEGVRVFKQEIKDCRMPDGDSLFVVIDCEPKITELEFKEAPCGKWIERKD